MISSLKRASARRITVVIPYYGYARQDRKMQVGWFVTISCRQPKKLHRIHFIGNPFVQQARVPISAADVARHLESIGIDRVIAVALHCGQIQGFFGPRIPVDNLDGGIVGINHFEGKDSHNPAIVSPDADGIYRAKKFKESLAHRYKMPDIKACPCWNPMFRIAIVSL